MRSGIGPVLYGWPGGELAAENCGGPLIQNGTKAPLCMASEIASGDAAVLVSRNAVDWGASVVLQSAGALGQQAEADPCCCVPFV